MIVQTDPFGNDGRRRAVRRVEISGTYRAPDGTHVRLKHGYELPDGHTLVRPDAPAAKADPAAPENKVEPAPEPKAKKPPVKKAATE